MPPQPQPIRPPWVVANWKMHKTPAEAAAFVARLRARWATARPACIAVIAPPFPDIPAVVEARAELDLPVAAQNLYWEEAGAFTGEVSGPMLVAAGCRFVLVGHSERRRLFHETDATVNRKLRAALAAGLVPILCVGEELEQRSRNETESVLESQLRGAFAGMAAPEIGACVLAYEPVWAIGTGRTATPEIAQAAHAFIRARLEQLATPAIAGRGTILYGGSVTVENFGALMAEPDVDGGLVGGASLDAEGFCRLAEIAGAGARVPGAEGRLE